jgi:DNA (cytosine-5)-methyltransferase 1
MLTFGSLFSGIGGLDLGLARSGMHCEWQVENDKFCQKVLAKHWPDVARYGDIRAVGKHNLSRVDVLAGGFPCQPYSLAGERKASEDERNLWPEFYRIICEIRPQWVVAENVVGLLSSEDGAFFGSILRDLAQAGYDARWVCVRASDVGAPHRRERIFLVAHSDSDRRWQWSDQQEPGEECEGETDTRAHGTQEPMAEVGQRREYTQGKSESRMGRGITRFSDWLDRYLWPAGPGEEQYEWEPRRVTQEKVPNRAARLKALGNAVVPQVAEVIGRMIMDDWRIH